jgi:2'-5' RNA ligase
MIKQLSLFEPQGLEDKRYPSKTPITIFEYFILISPDHKVKQYVRDLKEKLNQKIGLSEENVNSVPHLSLMLLRKGNIQDSTVIEKTKRSLSEESGFKIELSKATSLGHPETNDLILTVENPEPVKKIFKNLLAQFEPGRNHPRFFAPHITIGRGIPKKDFENISPALSEFDLKTEFLCRSITILRREVSRGVKSKYERIGEVMLGN